MKEIIDVVDNKGNVLYKEDKDVAHKEGLLHKEIHLWIVNDNNEVILQKRAANKSLYPSTWDLSVGGHVGAGEDSVCAMIREAQEELGIDVDINNVRYLGKINENLTDNGVNNNALVDVFIAKDNTWDITLQDEEVSDYAFVKFDDLFKLMETDKMIPHTEEYKMIKDYLRKKVIKDNLRRIKDFPKEGIDFKDVTTVLKDGEAFKAAIDSMSDKIDKDNVDVIVGPEARGIMFAAPLAYKLGKGYVPVRKPHKLPGEVISQSYELEYGTDSLEIHKDAIKPGDKVVIVDDLMATGGTMEAIIKLVERLGGEVVKIICLIDLPELKGRERLSNYDYEYILEEKENDNVLDNTNEINKELIKK